MVTNDQGGGKGLIDGLDLQFRCDRAFNNHVDERSRRRGHSNAVDGFNIALGETSAMETENVGNGGHPLEARWNRHVQLRRHRVRQLGQSQRGRVAEYPLWPISEDVWRMYAQHSGRDE